MVSDEVKGQHVSLWSVCVFCLLPALVNANCAKFEFPTANRDSSSDGEVTLSVPENQNVTIPFSLNVHTCNGRNPTFTVTVAKKENGVFKDVCKLTLAGSRSFSNPEGRCGKATGEGNFFVRKFMDPGDQTEWRWELSYMGTTAEDRRVQLRVYRPSGQTSSAGTLSEDRSSEAESTAKDRSSLEPTAKDSSSEEPTAEVTVTSCCPVYRPMALGLATVLVLVLALAGALVGWLWRRGRNPPRSGDRAHGQGTGAHCTQSALNDDYLEPAACAPLPPELSEDHYSAVRVADASDAVYSDPSIPPDGLEEVSQPYESLRMVDVGVSSVYSQICPHGNQTPQKP